MSCCFGGKEEEEPKAEDVPIAQPKEIPPASLTADNYNDNSVQNEPASANNAANTNSAEEEDNCGVQTFTFRELATATKNFRQECLLGEAGVGRIFKGTLTPSGQVVAVRQLDKNGMQERKDFVAEVSVLTQLEHPNLVKMIGCCADGEQRLLVYEYMPSGSLKGHLFDLATGDQPLDWTTRMKIALGIADGLEYLHEKINPPIIYRDLKSSSILLDEVNNPKLVEYGLAKLVQSSSNLHGGFGYGAPEYERNGELTARSDVYSFGVVLLELITGRKALDANKPTGEQNLVSWAQQYLKDPSKYPGMADPLLRKGFCVKSLNQAVGVAAMCLQDEPMARPLISDVSAALGFLASAPPEAPIPARLASILSNKANPLEESESMKLQDDASPSGGDSCDEDGSDYEYGYSEDDLDGEEGDEAGKSKKMRSSSKSKSKKKSGSIARSSTLSSRGGSSERFSLRCDSTFPDRHKEGDASS